MWDVSYLASMVQRNTSDDDVLTGLLDYMLEMAARHGILRIFAKVEDEIPELDLFLRTGFQRYARELTYVYDPAMQTETPPLPDIPSLRRWNCHHAWGLHQLYHAVTPQRVQMAEMLDNSEDFAKMHVGALTPLPQPLARGTENYVCDVGVRLGAWLRLCRGHGAAPHQLSLMVHPEHSDLAEPLLQFGIRKLQGESVRRVYCQVREYELNVIAALRDSGFEQATIRVLLVRHVALLALRQRTVPAIEQRVAYGVKSLGTVNSRQTTR